ncbi:MAG: hypothetical protein CMJ25_02515 [Phycisphaerae bacterium]|nr:hypothetical protein [Phycisphaerae bacterium]
MVYAVEVAQILKLTLLQLSASQQVNYKLIQCRHNQFKLMLFAHLVLVQHLMFQVTFLTKLQLEQTPLSHLINL